MDRARVVEFLAELTGLAHRFNIAIDTQSDGSPIGLVDNFPCPAEPAHNHWYGWVIAWSNRERCYYAVNEMASTSLARETRVWPDGSESEHPTH